ncbi:GLUG motif-containing protein [Paenibacillus sp. GYB003]|uniref:GLUG motif-containing protein n=1 Tax=Paenibacillus sp. GYB003 TaxID=2994392 RepID=UPI002F96375F
MNAFSKIMLMSLLSALLLSVLSPLSSFAAPATPPGSGTESDPYLISTVAHLKWVSDEVTNQANSFQGKFLKLANDVDVAGWTSSYPSFIGSTMYSPFNGTFDGDGHKLINLTKNNLFNNMATGLFAYIGSAGVIKNLGLENVNFNTVGDRVGAIAATNEGTIFNVYATGSIRATDGTQWYGVGGLVGSNLGSSVTNIKGTISASYSAVNVQGNQRVGGLVGFNSGILSNVFAKGDVSGVYYVGGLVGQSSGPSSIVNSYSTGNLFDNSPVGSWSGDHYFGGLVGGTEGGSSELDASHAYWNMDTSIIVEGVQQNPKLAFGSGDSAGITGKTTSEMTSPVFAQLLNANRSLSSVEWVSTSSVNEGYPLLALASTGEPSGDPGGSGGTGGSGENTGGGTGGSGDTGGSEGSGGIGGTIGSGVTQDFDIVGTVDATWIIVTVPTTVSFAILPDAADKSFVSAPFQVMNQSNAPIDVKFLGMHSTSQTSTKVVNAGKYSDQGWLKLPASKSSSEIALGINSDGKTIWSPAETEDQVPDTEVGWIKLERQGTKELSLDGKHGRAFNESKVMSYQMFLRVGLAS